MTNEFKLLEGGPGYGRTYRLAVRLAVYLKMQLLLEPAQRRKIHVINATEDHSLRVAELVRSTLTRWGVVNVDELMQLLESRVM
jgi:hypothetical protein